MARCARRLCDQPAHVGDHRHPGRRDPRLTNSNALDAFVHPDDLASVQAHKARIRETGAAHEFEMRHIRPDDGRIVWLRVTGIVAPGPDGQPMGLTGIVQDITPTKLEEDQRSILMAELDHRVKNVLATVLSLATQTARRTTSLDAFLQNFSGRLKAHGLGQRAAHRGRAGAAPPSTTWPPPSSARWSARTRRPGRDRNCSSPPGPPTRSRWGCMNSRPTRLKFGALSVETGRVELALGAPTGGRWFRGHLDRKRRPCGDPARPPRLRLDAAGAGDQP